MVGINATINVNYGEDSGVARFVNQIIIRPGRFSAGGDSGSLIVVNGDGDDRKPVGLLFAGSPSITVANPIGPVLTRFGVTIDAGAAAAPPPPLDETPPLLLSAEVNGTSLVLTYDEPLDGGSVPGIGDFSIGGAAQSVMGVGVSGTEVILTLSPGVAFGENMVTVSYTAGAVGARIQDIAGNGAVNLPNVPVTNTTPDPGGGGGAPIVGLCNPDMGSPGERQTVTVAGSNFLDGATVDFGERVNVQNVTFVSSTQLDVQIRVHNRAASGPRDVTVTNPDGQSSGPSGAGCFEVN